MQNKDPYPRGKGHLDDVSQIFSVLSVDGDIGESCGLTERGDASDDRPEASFHFVVSGTFCIRPSTLDVPARLQEGDFLFLPRSGTFTLADGLGRDARALDHVQDRVGCGHCCVVEPGGAEVARLWCGCFRFQRDDPFAAMLPRVVHIRASESPSLSGVRSTMELLIEEFGFHRLGSQVARQRLLELLFIQVFRAYATGPGASVGLLATLQNDKQVRQALVSMNAHLEHPWTIDLLARQAACSRTAFLTRFASLVGCPPLRYLTSLRMARARQLLLTSSSNVALVSEAVGYGSVEAFTRAFKRSFGIAPAELRARHGVPKRRGRDSQ